MLFTNPSDITQCYLSINALYRRRLLFTAITIADALHHLRRRQSACRLHNCPLAMHPLQLNRIEPRTLARKETNHKTAATGFSFLLAALDSTVIRFELVLNALSDVPSRVVPDQDKPLLAFLNHLIRQTAQEVARHITDGPSLNETQIHLALIFFRPCFSFGLVFLLALFYLARVCQQITVTGSGFGFRVSLSHLFLHQRQRLVLRLVVRSSMQVRLGQAASPNLVLQGQLPLRRLDKQAFQLVTTLFFAHKQGQDC